MEQKLLEKENVGGNRRERMLVVVLEQGARGLLHVIQFSVSYCIMLLFMYSNGMYHGLENTHSLGLKLTRYCRVHNNFDSLWCFGWICDVHERYPELEG